jgi:hypothetical protein
MSDYAAFHARQRGQPGARYSMLPVCVLEQLPASVTEPNLQLPFVSKRHAKLQDGPDRKGTQALPIPACGTSSDSRMSDMLGTSRAAAAVSCTCTCQQLACQSAAAAGSWQLHLHLHLPAVHSLQQRSVPRLDCHDCAAMHCLLLQVPDPQCATWQQWLGRQGQGHVVCRKAGSSNQKSHPFQLAQRPSRT